MECTGRYHEPILKALSEAGLFVSAVNPHLVKNFGNNSLRKVKSDPSDARKIARYTLDNWAELRQYSSMDNTRTQLKTLNSQFSFFMKQKVAAKANLIALLDNTYPGVNRLFDSPAREDGSEKWVDYAYSFWHVDCVRGIGLKAFTEQSIQQLNLASGHVERLRREMNELASTLPEYNTVMGIYGVGKTYGPQLIAEIGDVSRFTHREALTAFAGVDPGVDESGKHSAKSVPTTKRGSAHLRKTLYQIVCTYLKKSPADEPVYQFLDKKRSEGKPYFVYMTAAQNKFLRIYYARVKECLEAFDAQTTEQM